MRQRDGQKGLSLQVEGTKDQPIMGALEDTTSKFKYGLLFKKKKQKTKDGI